MIPRLGTLARTLPLDGTDWTLTYAPRVDAPAPRPPFDDPAYTTIPAQVPGTVELDLHRAGVIDDPFLGDNITQTWELEYGDWWYRTSFTLPEDWDAAGTALRFDGLDTIASVHLNGRLVGEPRNMLIEHELDVADALRPGENDLVVHLSSPLIAAEEFSYPAQLVQQVWDSSEALWIRKAPHMYGWDITPRLVSAGIFRSVALVRRPALRVDDWYMTTTHLDDDSATVELQYELSFAPRGRDVELRVTGRHRDGASFAGSTRPHFLSGRMRVQVDDPQRWLPRGLGSPELYDVEVSLLVDGEAVDRHRTRWGLRQITLDWHLKEGERGRFRVEVNGEPLVLLGTNWVPLDALHSRDAERLPEALRLLGESGCNAVRCWGGNVYESEAFYDWCDENGVLIWQDFAFACGRYPQQEPFLSQIAAEAASVVRRLRHHPALMLWCGGNETDDAFTDNGIDPGTDVLTRVVLPEAVRSHDWRTPYLANSPVRLAVRPLDDLPERHMWGPRSAFKADFYTQNQAEFVSEIGYQGMPALSSLAEFLPPATVSDITRDPAWKLHESDHLEYLNPENNGRNQLVLDQARLFMSGMDAEDLEPTVLASQLSQAEAMKFFVEQTRLGRGSKWGIMWWNLLDAWPQVSDAVVDYYFRPKLAFHYLARAQQPVCLLASEAAGWSRDLVLVSDHPEPATVTWTVRSATRGTELAGGTTAIQPRTNVVVGSLPLVPEGDCYLFAWEVEAAAGTWRGANHYTEGNPPLQLDRYRSVYLPQIGALAPAFTPEASWT